MTTEPKHGVIRISRSGVIGDDGVDTHLTEFLAEAKRRGTKVLDIGADEDRNEHLIKVMRVRADEPVVLRDSTPPAVVSNDTEAPTPERMREMREAFDNIMRPSSDIARQRAKKEAKRAARSAKWMFMRVQAGEGGEERLKSAIAAAKRQGIKVVDYRLDEDAGHYVIRANNKPQPKHRKRK